MAADADEAADGDVRWVAALDERRAGVEVERHNAVVVLEIVEIALHLEEHAAAVEGDALELLAVQRKGALLAAVVIEEAEVAVAGDGDDAEEAGAALVEAQEQAVEVDEPKILQEVEGGKKRERDLNNWKIHEI